MILQQSMVNYSIYFPQHNSRKKEGYEHLKNWLLNIDKDIETVYVVSCDEAIFPTQSNRKLPVSAPQDFSNYHLVLIVNRHARIDELQEKVGNFKSITVITWHEYWLDIGLSEIINAQGDNIDPLLTSSFEFNKLYTLFNNEPRSHRIKLLDLLHRRDLFNDGYVSIHKLGSTEKESFLHWKNPKEQILDGQYYTMKEDINATRMIFPPQWYQTPIHIVTESTHEMIFITEKLAQAILGGKPFMVLAGEGYHQHLRHLGFRMYDNIFDYKFDRRPKVEDRIQGIIYNLLSVKNKSWNKLYSKCKKNIIYNYNNYIRLIKDARAKIEPAVLEKIIQQKNLILDYNNIILHNRKL